MTYLSWPWAWAEVKRRFEDASYTIWKDENNRPYILDPETGYMVYTTVTIGGVTHEMWLPVMDGNNRAMLAHPYEVKAKYNSFTVQPATMFDVNKAIMRCLTKNLAMFGLGLYIYAGEDLPEDSDEEIAKTASDGKEDARAKYQELIAYCKEHDHDIKAVAKEFGLNAKSTAQEFDTAMRRLILSDSKAGSDDMVEV